MKITLPVLLSLVFLVLKLTHFISWSWWLVLLPLYGLPLAILGLAMSIFVFAFLVALTGESLSEDSTR